MKTTELKDNIGYSLEALENKYNFECEAGPLSLCKEWIELKEEIQFLRETVAEYLQ